MYIIHDKRVPAGYIDIIAKQFPLAEFLPFSPQEPKVYSSIFSHPDIYMFQLDPKTLVHSPGLDTEFLSKLKYSGICLIRGEKDPCGTYPSTALYNAARVGDKVFLNKEYIDKSILESVEAKGLIPIDVSQGYTRCSILAVGTDSFITSDRKIADVGRKIGMKVLAISSGNVELPGEKHGFIGGAGGLTTQGKVVLLGDVNFHPQGSEITDFINIHSPGHACVENLPLYDAGSLFFVEGTSL